MRIFSRNPEPEYFPVRIELSDELRAKRASALTSELKDVLPRVLDGELVRLPADPPPGRSWSIHACPLDPQCRALDVPPSLHLGLGQWHATLALGPSARSRGFGSHLGGLVALAPTGDNVCRQVVRLTYEEGALASFRVCPRRRGHRGRCLDLERSERVTFPTLEHL